MLRAILVDDEQNNLDNLEFMLLNDCEGIRILAKLHNATEAREWLSQNSCDLLFLDINMPGETGFDLLKSLPDTPFKVIFVTAYSEYSLQAIKASAVDYILKPVKIQDLQEALEKVKKMLGNQMALQQSQYLLQQLLQTGNFQSPPKKIALPQLGGIIYVEVDEIVSLEADGNYTVIHKTDKQKLVVSKSLKEFDDLLDQHQFSRIHKSYIINIQYVKEYSTVEGAVVKMTDGNEWSISRRQLEHFMNQMDQHSLRFRKH
ncbi:MAG TPA: LytTR family DNA-binding domain-containing protein [Chitinophagaceae bacterium]|nr:LytTR family DNA-binding domain-containing protein [Chitinophagaceae bacterium]HNF71985.1 LytTR family DNA-binding domain-containing protein [Chitinophagaceae bacterium]